MQTHAHSCYARLAQSGEHETLNLRVVGSSPTLGAESCFNFFFSFSKLTVCLTVFLMFPFSVYCKLIAN